MVARKHRIPDGPTLPPLPDETRALLRGRPSSYKPSFAQELLEDSGEGYSLGGFAGKIGVARSTINDWVARYPEFAEACARAKAARQRWWESILLHVAETGGQGSQGQVAIFGAINCGAEDWRQKQEVEHTGQLTLASLIERSMKTIEGRIVEPDQSPDAVLSEKSNDLFG